MRRRFNAIKWASVKHDMTQGFVLTQYFYEALMQFEKDFRRVYETPSAKWCTAWTLSSRCIVRGKSSLTRRQMAMFCSAANLACLQVLIWLRHALRLETWQLLVLWLAIANCAYRHTGIGSRRGSGQLRSCARSYYDWPSRRGNRSISEDDCHQQGAAPAGVVPYLFRPHAGPRLQTRSGRIGIQSGPGSARR